ncbi:MAG: IS1 family transposase [Acidimicrobiales bacterium]
MNRLSTERRGQVVSLLCEGMSIRSIVRVTGVAKNTVTKLLVDLGAACAEYQDAVLTNLRPSRMECDEIWSFCYAKQKNVPDEFQDTPGYGDVWTWVAVDADTKLVPSWLVGERTMADAYTFIADMRSRIDPSHRIQLTTDGLRLYIDVVDSLFRDNIDYSVLHKLYGSDADTERTYSPSQCIGIDKRVIAGTPDLDKAGTSFVERQNLTMRMGMRRFTRLTNAFSKKLENLTHAVNLHYMYYNFARPHQTLTKRYGKPTTPAMAAGIAKYPWSYTQIASLLD